MKVKMERLLELRNKGLSLRGIKAELAYQIVSALYRVHVEDLEKIESLRAERDDLLKETETRKTQTKLGMVRLLNVVEQER